MRAEVPAKVRKLNVGGFVFNPDTGEVVAPGHRSATRLRPRAAKLLFHLAERPGQLVSRQELQQLLWGDRLVDAEQGLNACMRDVRQMLGDRAAEPKLIETLPGRGYRLIARVKPMATAWYQPGSRAAVVIACVVILGALWLWFQPSPQNLLASREVRTLLLEAEHLAKGGEAGALSRSLRLLEEAIELDPDFAPAHGKLAQVNFLSGNLAGARASAERALALDPGLAEAHAAVGFLDFYENLDPQRAEQHLRRAIRLDPASATSRHALAHFLVVNGRPQRAIEEIEVALELDPADTRLRGDASWVFYWARRFPEAAKHAHRALILAPSDQASRVCRFRSLVADGRTAAAAEALVELVRGAGLPAEVLVDLRTGPSEERIARYWQYLANAAEPSPDRLLALVQVGREGDALREFKALTETASAVDLRYLLLDPLLDPVRDQIASADQGRQG